MFPNLHVCWHKCTHKWQMQLQEKMGIEANAHNSRAGEGVGMRTPLMLLLASQS